MDDDDEETPLEERIETVMGVLGTATEEDQDLASFAEGLGAYWRRKAAAAKVHAGGPSADQAKEVLAFQARLEAEKQAAEAAARRAAEELQQRTRDRQESRGREVLLNKYGFDADCVDEDGNVVASASGCGADAELGAVFGGNANKAQVAEAAKAQREAAKAQHAKKVAREKGLLLQQKVKKEAEKRRTQKREKQRGCG